MPKNSQTFAPDVLGKTIAKHRLAIGLTQDTVAEKLGIGVEAVSRIERGVAVPTINRLVQFADLYDCQLADLLCTASKRYCDQAAYIARLIEQLDLDDRKLVLDLIERLVDHLAQNSNGNQNSGLISELNYN